MEVIYFLNQVASYLPCFLKLLLSWKCVCTRVETGSGHPGHVFARSSGSDPDSALDHV